MEIKHTLNRAIIQTDTNNSLFIKCPVCARTINWNQETQEKFQKGGIGHQCNNCKSYIGVVICTNCYKQYLIDNDEWCSINNENPFVCPNCQEPLVQGKDGGVSLSMEVIEKSMLHAYTKSKWESAYINKMKKTLSLELKDALAIFHETTYERINLAGDQLEKLLNYEISISYEIFNNEQLRGTTQKGGKFHDNKHQHLIYVLVLSLFSALESMLQEINVVCRLGYKERKVDFNLLKKIPDKYDILNKECNKISEHPLIFYLKDLRNLLAHRRVSLLASDVRYDLPQPTPFKPNAVKGVCVTYLPDQPLVTIGNESYTQNKEVKKTLSELYEYICDAKERIYMALSK